MSGSGNPNWIGGVSFCNYGDNWNKQRRKARERDNYTCQECKYVSGGDRLLDVHHRTPFRLFGGDWKMANRLNNLVCLCRDCHVKEEIRIRSVP